jgi:hypothetical protein
MWPIRRRETALRAQHEIDYVRYIDDRAAYDEARKRATKTTKGDRATIRAMLYTLGPEPVPPLVPMLTCPEPTYEGMCRLLRVGHPSIGIFAAEGGQFIGGHGMKEEARLFTAAGLSALWDGDPIRRVRAVDGITILPGRRVSMHLMAQPTVADILLRDRLLADQGLLSRVLISAGDSAMGTRVRREGSAEANRAMECYGARLLSILEVPLPFVTDKPNELQPRRLTLSAAARRVWDGFADHVETMLGSDGELRAISGIANKLPEHAARLAGARALSSTGCVAARLGASCGAEDGRVPPLRSLCAAYGGSETAPNFSRISRFSRGSTRHRKLRRCTGRRKSGSQGYRC